MRAIAVLLVVIGHASIGWLAGGFVGVDVFFVISGFLITSLLTKELVETGKISIRQFYTRRVLRLLPASTLVLLATLLATWSWLSPLRFAGTVRDKPARSISSICGSPTSALPGLRRSAVAVQHFWPLAVEEQFTCLAGAHPLATLWSRRQGQARLDLLAVVPRR
jgi:peptidoglycan/LPS O-acetylase OafA/YrhL